MKNHITIYLDNIKLADTDWAGGEFEITKSFDKKADYTTDIEFFGNAYQYIKDKLIDNRITSINQPVPTPNGVVVMPVKAINTVIVKVYDNCCGDNKLIFNGKVENISYDAIRCSIKATLIENTIYTKLENYYFNKSRYFDTKNLPKVGYCAEPTPKFIHDFIVIVAFFAKVILFIVVSGLFPILLVIELLDEVLEFLGFGGIDFDSSADFSVIDILSDLFKSINEFSFDCLKVHPAPYVREIVNDFIIECGIDSFVSEVYNAPASPYYNTLFFQAEVKEGYLKESNENKLGLIPENEPVYSAIEILDMICKPFNSEWRVIGNILYIKHKNEWLNSELLDVPDNLKTEEYNTKDDINPAYAQVEFTTDGTDNSGNTAKNVWYKKILEFNSPPANFQKGKKSFSIPLGMHRQVNDGVDRSVTWFWIEDSIISPAISLIFARSPSEVDKLLSLSNGTCLTPKLLIWNETTQRIENLNKPYHLKENGINGELAKYFETENPRINGYKFFQYTITTEPLKCVDFNKYADSLGKRLKTRQGFAIISELRVNYTKRTITFSGNV